MIPFPMTALRDVTVLVTRPAEQAGRLCDLIRTHGGHAIAFPALAIEALAATPTSEVYDWLIFTSANAVRCGLPLVSVSGARIAAIGGATAAALQARDLRVDAVPERGSSSESLLAQPAFAAVAGQRILIVKGAGGRDALQSGLAERGARVATLEVYRRIRPETDAAMLTELEQEWRTTGVDIVALTSVEALHNLTAMIGPVLQPLLKATPLVTFSQRIVDAARQHGMQGEAVLARDADDESLVGAIAAWHARAR